MIYFTTYADARSWIKDNEDNISVRGGEINYSTMEVKFPNGNKLIIGYHDIEKYISYEFLFVFGCKELNSKVRI